MYQRGRVLDVQVYSLREHGVDLAVSENFRLIEFACRDGSDVVLIHPQLVALLEQIRATVGAPIHINSAYRTPSHNASIGGKSRSAHLYGFAADITCRTTDPTELAEIAEGLDPGGLGRYRSFVHVDVASTNRRWAA